MAQSRSFLVPSSSSSSIVSPAEFRAAEKKVQSLLKKARDSNRALASMKNLFQPLKLTAKLGQFNPNAYLNRTKFQTDIISRLPPEIKRLIWLLLDEAADRLMLALTCKWNARYFEELKAQAKRRYKADMHTKQQNTTSSRRIISNSEARFLRSLIRPVSKRDRFSVMYRLQGWVSPNGTSTSSWRLCFNCLKFRQKNSTGRAQGWGGREIVLRQPNDYTSNEIKMAMTEGYRCPQCKERTAVELMKYRNECKELKRMLSGVKS